MNILYLNLIQLGFILLFFNGKKHVAGQFFVNETQGIGFSLNLTKKNSSELATGSLNSR